MPVYQVKILLDCVTWVESETPMDIMDIRKEAKIKAIMELSHLRKLENQIDSAICDIREY